ncbi:hypothetical protein RYX56_24775, partial [Alkalihalophilus lindianensis]
PASISSASFRFLVREPSVPFMPHLYADGDVAMLNSSVSDLKDSVPEQWTISIIPSIPPSCIGKAR